jgi:hypothetical protein
LSLSKCGGGGGGVQERTAVKDHDGVERIRKKQSDMTKRERERESLVLECHDAARRASSLSGTGKK